MFHQVNALRELGAEVEVLTRERLAGARFPLDVRSSDVVHLHSLALAEVALELTRRHGLPLVYTAHSILELELDARGSRWIELQRRTFKEAGRVIFVSRAEHAVAIERMPSLATRAHFLHNGVPAPPPAGIYDQSGPVVFAGRFTRSKGFDLMLEIVRESLGDLTSPARFVLAGGHGNRDLHEAAQALEGDRCSVPGWLGREEVESLFASAGLVLVPSRYEPFGMVAIEAMRLGAPVLASTRLQELFGPGSGGRCIEELTSTAWIAAIRSLLGDPAERAAMHLRGPEYVAEHFAAARLAPTVYGLLHTAS